MFDDEAVTVLERAFNKLELSLIIEALIAYRGMGVRPDFEEIGEEHLIITDDIEIPTRPIYDNEDETLTEMMFLFMAGFVNVNKVERDIVKDSAETLLSEISDYLKGE